VPRCTISVVIPARNEGQRIAAAIHSVRAADEVLVVDGGSTDDTVEAARMAGARVMTAEPGRGLQLAAGAREATGDWLVFLHADTRLGAGWRDAVMALGSGAAAGAFRLTIDAPGFAYRAMERLAAWRCRWLRIPYGDQGLAVRRDAYVRAGGYAPLPLMEDVDLAWRLMRLGRFVLLRTPAVTSPRRWRDRGPLHALVRNWSALILLLLGVRPTAVARAVLWLAGDRAAGRRSSRCGTSPD
jgi:rSAM/selenodomain-associated transferase 2